MERDIRRDGFGELRWRRATDMTTVGELEKITPARRECTRKGILGRKIRFCGGY